jgi:hypothetical protein
VAVSRVGVYGSSCVTKLSRNALCVALVRRFMGRARQVIAASATMHTALLVHHQAWTRWARFTAAMEVKRRGVC